MTLTLALLGDSIGYGQGASRPADTIGSRLAAHLTAAGIPTDVVVFAVPGARSADLAAQVARASTSPPDVAVIVIGANDLTHFVPPETAAEHLGDAVRALVRLSVRVVVAPAPDLSALPVVPAPLRAVVQAGSTVLRQAQTRAALAEGARVAHVEGRTSAAFASDPTLFSADRFHPSSAGYALITQTLAPAVLAAAKELDPRRG
jgi:lysophospholipase L1-like esterase